MNDGGGSGFQKATGEIVQTVGEVAKDIKDAVGEALEQGVQSVTNTQLTPQQIQQKQQEDQNKLAEARRKIEWLKNVDSQQKQVIAANRQKESERLQNQQQEKQEEVQQIQTKTVKKQAMSDEIARSQAELRVGKGVGG